MQKTITQSLPMTQPQPRLSAQPVVMTQAEIRRLVLETIG
jgi:hypothetical protein